MCYISYQTAKNIRRMYNISSSCMHSLKLKSLNFCEVSQFYHVIIEILFTLNLSHDLLKKDESEMHKMI